MVESSIRFDDGAAYEQMMGIWSRAAGEIFLDWLAPPTGLRWIDIGCGNGAFTQLLVERCAPAEVQGIDPSEGQLAFARTRPALRSANFQRGEAQALPFADNSFDAAVMALVVVFVPDPAAGVTEMVRVVKPGGIVATYVWDMLDGGFPLDPIRVEMHVMGLSPPHPPRVDVSAMKALHDLWTRGGLEAVETREIVVSRTFDDFDAFWAINMTAPSLAPIVAGMTANDIEALKDRLSARLPADAKGRITYQSRAHAIKGRSAK